MTRMKVRRQFDSRTYFPGDRTDGSSNTWLIFLNVGFLALHCTVVRQVFEVFGLWYRWCTWNFQFWKMLSISNFDDIFITYRVRNLTKIRWTQVKKICSILLKRSKHTWMFPWRSLKAVHSRGKVESMWICVLQGKNDFMWIWLLYLCDPFWTFYISSVPHSPM